MPSQEDRATAVGVAMATCTKNLVKFGRTVFELCDGQTDRQTNRRTNRLITILRNPNGVK